MAFQLRYSPLTRPLANRHCRVSPQRHLLALMSSSSTAGLRFPVSPVPPNPLGPGRVVRSAAAIIIGDEILNGKTLDLNSNFFARYCFEHGIELKRIEVIADDENQIIEASRRMVENYDLVVTSGGIGATHDDISYASLAKAFSQSLVHHAETQRRMEQMNTHGKSCTAARKMATFPEHAEVLFVDECMWVPVVRLHGKLHALPGIPVLFQALLKGLTPYLPLPPPIERPLRIQIFIDQPESMIAPYLSSLQARLKPFGIQVGSYPDLGKGVFVSLIGRDRPADSASASRIWIADIARQVEKDLGGSVLSEEEVAKMKEAKKLVY